MASGAADRRATTGASITRSGSLTGPASTFTATKVSRGTRSFTGRPYGPPLGPSRPIGRVSASTVGRVRTTTCRGAITCGSTRPSRSCRVPTTVASSRARGCGRLRLTGPAIFIAGTGICSSSPRFCRRPVTRRPGDPTGPSAATRNAPPATL